MHRPMLKRSSRRVAMLLALLSTGCVFGSISPADKGEAIPPGRVASVYVTCGSIQDVDSRARYDNLHGATVIAKDVTDALRRDGRFDPAGPVYVHVNLTSMKLRSTSVALWLGVFAGIDSIDGEIEFQRPPSLPTHYRFHVSGAQDLYFVTGVGHRFNSLAEKLADKITSVIDEAAEEPQGIASAR